MLDGGDILNTQLSAESLHHAVLRLREKSRVYLGFGEASSDPLVWATYIHVGV